jgi:uncharacterized protein (DUF2062 family)
MASSPVDPSATPSPRHFNPVVVAPTYDNARTLGGIIDAVTALGLPLVVVNDGSTDGTAGLLSERDQAPGVTVLTHGRNRGKAAALQTGFAHASGAGFTHAVTIDTDGQHDPAEIPKLLDRARQSPEALVLGLRDESVPGYPAKSLLGRRLSNLFIRMESGLRVDDSQCGMRVYPLGLVKAVRASARRYGFETEIVTRAGWAGCEVIEVPVACRYLSAGERVSHLNPLLDTLRAIGMHARLLARALSPRPTHPQWPSRPTTDEKDSRRLHRRLLDWLNPADAWRQARRDRVGRESFAAGLAIGAFIGNLPTYGLHAFLGLFAARRLHLHPLAVVIGTHISTPPLGPVLNAAAIALGHLVLHRSLPSSGTYNFHELGFLGVLRRMALEWVIGSPIVGFVCAILVFMISSRMLRLAAAKDHVTPGSAATGLTGATNPDTPGSAAAHPAEPAPGPAA